MTVKEMQEQWLNKNKVTECPDSNPLWNGETRVEADRKKRKSDLPSRFERITAHCTCLDCRKSYTPYSMGKSFSIICRGCSQIRIKENKKHQNSYATILYKQLKEYNFIPANVGLYSTEYLEEVKKVILAYIHASRRTSKIMAKKMRIIEEELESRKVKEEETEEVVGDYKTSVTGYEFDF